MAVYDFIYKKLSESIGKYQNQSLSMRIGFGERHTDNFVEMTAHPCNLNMHEILINSKHLFFGTNADGAIFCIEDYGKLDVSKQCIDLLTKISDEFEDDFIDDVTSRWKLFIFDDMEKNVYELDVLSIQILTTQEEAIVRCKNCKRKAMTR